MSLMIFIFLCFTGLFVMFFFILRGQEKIHAALREELAMMRAHMRQMEAQISGVPVPSVQEEHAPAQAVHHVAPPAPLDRFDPLDSLSMDSSTPPASGGLDLHFDPQQDFRR